MYSYKRNPKENTPPQADRCKMNNLKEKYLRKYSISEILLFLFLAIFPFEKHAAVFVLYALVLSVIITGSYLNFKQNIKENKVLLVLASIYLLYFLRILLQGESTFDLEQKLSLLVFPLTLLYSNINFTKNYLSAKIIYLFSSVASIVCCFLIALYNYSLSDNVSYFFYDKLSFFIHVGYYAMFLCLAMAIALDLFLFSDFSRRRKNIFLISAIILAVGVLFLSAKASLFAMILIFFLFGFRFVQKTKQWKKALLFFLLIIFFGILAYFFLDVLKERIDTFISSLIEPPQHADTTSSREMIWQRAFELIERKPFFGYGADANNMLFESYRNHGMTVELEKKLNAHNEFLQMFLGLGVIGFIFLSYVLIKGFIVSIKNSDIVFLSFLIIIFIGFATESMLETEAGILYFSMFYCLFMITKKANANDD